MIFVTVGTQLPFDRLVEAVDKWAGEAQQGVEIIGQIGSGSYRPKNFKAVSGMTPTEYAACFDKAELIISHVGMGTIINGLEKAKLMILMPRLARYGEHRNDHQLGSAEKFGDHHLIDVVTETDKLAKVIANKLQEAKERQNSPQKIQPSEDLLVRIREFINGD